jgi:hypothetical protein
MAATRDRGDAYANAKAMADLPGVTLLLNEGEEHGFAYLAARAETMAVFFGEYLGYHHLGKSYATGATPKQGSPATKVINDMTVSEKKAAEAHK